LADAARGEAFIIPHYAFKYKVHTKRTGLVLIVCCMFSDMTFSVQPLSVCAVAQGGC